MEDHLKNKDRLEKEWEALCAYQAEPNACTIGMKDGNAKKNRSTAVVACKQCIFSFARVESASTSGRALHWASIFSKSGHENGGRSWKNHQISVCSSKSEKELNVKAKKNQRIVIILIDMVFAMWVFVEIVIVASHYHLR